MNKWFIVLMLIAVTACTISNRNSEFYPEEPIVKVRILHTKAEVKVALHSEWQIKSEHGAVVKGKKSDRLKFTTTGSKVQLYVNNEFVLEGMHIQLKAESNFKGLMINDVPYGIGWWWEGVQDRYYHGNMHVFPDSSGTIVWVVELPLEDYLKGVVPYEIGPDSPLEALKAQAVAARSEAMVALNSGLYGSENYNLTSDVECQVFAGDQRRTKKSDKAVNETAGVILTENNQPINAYYASSCGGHSEIISNVWPDRERYTSYLGSAIDNIDAGFIALNDEDAIKRWIDAEPQVFCNPNLGVELPKFSHQNFRWEKSFEDTILTRFFAQSEAWGKFTELEVLKRGASGRIVEANFIFENHQQLVKGELNIRQMWQPALRSSCFYMEKAGSVFILRGAGWGHGVGMCQSGAIGMAKHGYTYKEILNHYYKKADISSVQEL